MRQLQLTMPSSWGAKRRKAGRKPAGPRPRVSHAPRPVIDKLTPVHVTVRVLPHVFNLRSARSFRVIARAIWKGADAVDVTFHDFSVQGDHLHLIAEAPSEEALGRAMQRLLIKIALGLNRMMGRHGKVFADRYHVHVLRTPTEVAHARRYVLQNIVKHERSSWSGPVVDCWSSAAWPRLVRPARSWLLREGWKRARPPDGATARRARRQPRPAARRSCPG